MRETGRSIWEDGTINKKYVRILVEAAAISGVLAYLFYDSVYGMVVIAVFGPLYSSQRRLELKEKKRYVLEKQFQEGLYSAAAALEAGYSMENAWREAEKEQLRMHGRDGVFYRCLYRMNQKISLNEPIEKLILEFSRYAGTESIQNFADIFSFAKRSGGNLTAIMKKTADRIRINVQIQEEIATMLSARRLEQNIMNIMPLGILLYIRTGVPGFLDPLYHCTFGVLIMSACLAGYLGAWKLSCHMMQIHV